MIVYPTSHLGQSLVETFSVIKSFSPPSQHSMKNESIFGKIITYILVFLGIKKKTSLKQQSSPRSTNYTVIYDPEKPTVARLLFERKRGGSTDHVTVIKLSNKQDSEHPTVTLGTVIGLIPKSLHQDLILSVLKILKDTRTTVISLETISPETHLWAILASDQNLAPEFMTWYVQKFLYTHQTLLEKTLELPTATS